MGKYFDLWQVQIFASILTTIGFGIVFNIRGNNLFFGGIAGGISWGVYLIGKNLGITDGFTYFFATLALALYSEVMARKLKTTVTTLLIPALIPLAPGGGIYYMMYNLINKNYAQALEKGMSTFIIAGAMAVGIFAAANITMVLKRSRENGL